MKFENYFKIEGFVEGPNNETIAHYMPTINIDEIPESILNECTPCDGCGKVFKWRDMVETKDEDDIIDICCPECARCE